MGKEGRLVVSRIALKYLLVTAFVSGIVAVIWSGRHLRPYQACCDYVPPPITAPARQNQPPITHTTTGLVIGLCDDV